MLGFRQVGSKRQLRRGVEGGRELDGDDDEEVAVLEGRLEPRQALASDGLHQPLVLVRLGVGDDEELRALGCCLGLHGLCEAALLEDGAPALHHEAPNALALELARIHRLLAHLEVIRLGNGRVLQGRRVTIIEELPGGFLLVAKRVVGHRLQDLARLGLDDEDPVVEVLHLHLEAAERLAERDFPLYVEVVALALEFGVGLLLQHKDHVASLAIWDLVRLLREVDLVLVRCALGNVHLELLLHLLLSEDGALSTALFAHLLHLLDHRTHADRLELVTTAVARRAPLDALLFVDDLARQAECARRALVNLLQRHLERVHHILSLLHSPVRGLPATTGEHVKNIARTTAVTSAVL
mmetsp:Transcript_28636/g.61605  ORF Transcript_28636/g.61605 Transcript_28636/m.61605 type:complete len:354 (-) Transcript_28636:369-1430(-)